MSWDIKERTFQFGLRIVYLSSDLMQTGVGRILGRQVLRSGTSVGANVEEAVAAYSRTDYIYKMNIALKEARETHYWLRLIGESDPVEPERLSDLLREADEIKKVLGSIVVNLKKHSKSS